MATKLSVFNAALVDMGQRRLSDTGEEVESGRELVSVWDQVVLDCLSEADWNFAVETVKLAADTGVEPSFGSKTEFFAKPSDWVATVAISEDSDFALPLVTFDDDADYWAAPGSPIYVRYVSSDTGMGLNLARWTPNFRRYVELELASRTAFKITNNGKIAEGIMKMRDKARLNAKNKDAMNEPNPRFAPPSSWSQARGSLTTRNGSRWDKTFR